MRLMQKRTSSNNFLLLLTVSMLLSLFFVLSFSLALKDTAFANGDADISQLEINSVKNINLISNEYSYVNFISKSESTYIYTLTSMNGNVATKVFTADNSEEITPKIIDTGVFSIDLKKDTTYKIGFVSTEKETIQLCIKEKDNAFEWLIDGNTILEKEISLTRGKAYSVSFFINGMHCNNKLSGENNTVYDYTFDYNILHISSQSLIGGNGFTLTSFSNKGIIIDKITVVPDFNYDISIEGTFDKGSARGLNFVYQEGISKLTYTVSYLDIMVEETIDSIGNTLIKDLKDGQIYELDVINTLNGIGSKQGNAKIAITAAELATADKDFIEYSVIERSDIVPMSLTWVGSGTSSNPYLVSSTAHFNAINTKDGSGVYFRQTVNLNFENTATTRNVSFKGIYNGNCKEIINIFIGASTPFYDGGLFDQNLGTITNISRYIVKMEYGHMGYAGGFVGKNSGYIETPYSYYKATLIFDSNNSSAYTVIGGIVGQNSSYAEIIMKNTIYVYITSNGCIGGYIGENLANGVMYPKTTNNCNLYGEIKYYYSNNNFADVGGFAAINRGKININEDGQSCITPNYLSFIISNRGNTSISVQPRVGACVGSQTIGAQMFGNFAGFYNLSALLTSQRTKVDFHNNFIGEII